MFTDHRFQILFGGVGSLHDDLITKHNGRSFRESQFEIRVEIIFLFGLGYSFDFNVILFAQPGRPFLQIISCLPFGLVEEKSDLQHEILLYLGVGLKIKLLLAVSYIFLTSAMRIKN